MAQMVLEANGLSVELEKAGERLSGLAHSLVSVRKVIRDTGQQTDISRDLAGAQVAETLIEGFGGAEDYAKATSAFYQEFFTEGERVANLQRDLNWQLKRAGIDIIPDSLRGYRDLANSQDLNTEAGRELYTTLLDLAPAFAKVTNFANQAGASMGALEGGGSRRRKPHNTIHSTPAGHLPTPNGPAAQQHAVRYERRHEPAGHPIGHARRYRRGAAGRHPQRWAIPRPGAKRSSGRPTGLHSRFWSRTFPSVRPHG